MRRGPTDGVQQLTELSAVDAENGRQLGSLAHRSWRVVFSRPDPDLAVRAVGGPEKFLLFELPTNEEGVLAFWS